MLQALYFCRPFREGLLEYYERLPETHEENLLTCLGELFFEIASQNKRTGCLLYTSPSPRDRG